MKKILLIIVFSTSLSSYATHWLEYYVYFETEYSQGPWSRYDNLEQSNYIYLTVQLFEDLFGSLEEQLVEQILIKLKERKPDLYNWNYDFSIEERTVIISTNKIPKNQQTIKNEITASLTLNNFDAVKFILGNEVDTLNANDITVPYFDLVSNQAKLPTNYKDETKVEVEVDSTETKNKLIYWLYLSIVINLILFLFILFNRITSDALTFKNYL